MNQNVSSKKESRASLELQSYLIAKNWWVRKLHGNLYQMGLPDLMVVRHRDGKIILIELKMLPKRGIQGKTPYTQFTLIAKLRGPQTGAIIMLSRLRAPVYVIANSPEGWYIAGNPIQQDESIYPLTIEELYEIINEK